MKELPEYDPALQNATPKWKQNVIRLLSLIQCVSWSVFVVRIVFQDHFDDIVYPSLNAMLWVSVLNMKLNFVSV